MGKQKMMNSYDIMLTMWFSYIHIFYAVDIININSYKYMFQFGIHTRSDSFIIKVLEYRVSQKKKKRKKKKKKKVQ